MKSSWNAWFLILASVSVPAAADDYTIDSLTRSLESRVLSDQDQVLSLLPSEFFTRYTLIYRSGSLQAATPQSPRVIVAGPRAEFVLAFTDENASYGGDEIEAIQYRRELAKFEFFVIRPDSSGALRVRPGVGCTLCHGQDPRPNFQPYATWPGFFGSDDDRLAGGVSLPTEQGWLTTFAQSASSRHRYRMLQGITDGYRPVAGSESRTEFAHNFELTFRIAQMNYRRISRILSERADWPKLKYAWLMSVGCGSEFASAFPDAMKPPAAMQFNDFAEVQDGKTPAFIYMMKRYGLDPSVLSTQAPSVTVEPFRGNIFGSGGSSASEMTGQLLLWDPEFISQYGSTFDYHHQEMTAQFGQIFNCERLAARSREAMSAP